MKNNTSVLTVVMAGLTLACGTVDAQQSASGIIAPVAQSREAYLKRFDANKDGRVDSEERAAASKILREEYQKRHLKQYDLDGDGKVSSEERRKVHEKLRRERELKTYDKNGDGKITDAERQKVRDEHRARYNKRIEEYRERMRIRQYDQDGDGKLNPVEKANMDAATAAEKKKEEDNKKAVVKKYDTDGNGKLSPKEIAEMRKKIAALLEQLKSVEMYSQTLKNEGNTVMREIDSDIRNFKYQRNYNYFNRYQGAWSGRRGSGVATPARPASGGVSRLIQGGRSSRSSSGADAGATESRKK